MCPGQVWVACGQQVAIVFIAGSVERPPKEPLLGMWGVTPADG